MLQVLGIEKLSELGLNYLLAVAGTYGNAFRLR